MTKVDKAITDYKWDKWDDGFNSGLERAQQIIKQYLGEEK